MSPELGAKIYEGRKRELLEMQFVTDPKEIAKMSNPQAEKTFLESKLNWAEVEQEKHRRLLDLYRAGLKLRKQLFGKTNPARSEWQVSADERGVSIVYQLGKQRVTVAFCLKSCCQSPAPAGSILLRSNAPRRHGGG